MPTNTFITSAIVGAICAALGFAAGTQFARPRAPATLEPTPSEPQIAVNPPPQSPAPAGDGTSSAPAPEPTSEAPVKTPEEVAPSPPPTEAPVAEPDPWRVREDTSEIDDSKRVTLMATAEDRYNAFGMRSQPALIIRCQERSTDLYIAVDEYLGMDTISVTARTDDDKAVTSTWGISTDSKAMFARGAIGLARKLASKKSLTVRFTPYNESPVTLTFDVSHLDEHLPKVASACGWKP
ncbi:MAG: type VI secretion protein [Alphaproteobacteria bacterium]|nr:type VI secretion protein [Alphaproteobacteria bacterium]